MQNKLKLIRWRRISPIFQNLHISYNANTEEFAKSRTGTFVQEKPVLGNQFSDDPLLEKYLKKTVPAEVFNEIKEDLCNFGDAVSKDIYYHHANVCLNEPVLEQYDAWGNRVDNIIMHPSWRALHDVSAKEGLIAIPYENKYAQWSRLYQTAKLYLFSPSSGLYSCPLAMTDGASFILKSQQKDPFLSAYQRLTSRDPELFWTSGQWMTEKQGGSDVGDGASTLAKYQSEGIYRLYGYKWFTSATDADVSLTLGRVIDQEGKATKGSKGLTMFYLQTREKDGKLNGISIEKFKKKLGTKQMPTAEIILDGTVAYQLSDIGAGISAISPMLTVTRIHNSISAAACMRRILNLSKDFARKRHAFGNLLINHPVHVQTLSRMEVEQQGAFLFLMEVARLFGLQENKMATDKDLLLLRILTPILKLYTGKQAVSVCSEGLESFGGHGYLEDTLLPVLLRDAQVLSIWEGTTNILSLDVLRAIMKTNGEALKTFLEDASSRINRVNPKMESTHTILKKNIYSLQTFVSSPQAKDSSILSYAARDFAYSLARTYMETSQLICRANQLTGFYMMGTLAVKGLKKCSC